MTVEERAQAILEERLNQKPWEGAEELKAKYIQHLRDQIEDCAKVTDQEVHRLDSISMEYKQKGDLETVVRTSACTLTAGKLGRDIRALAAPTETDRKERLHDNT